VDGDQLAVPWGKYSILKQPWRSWVETVPADRFLDGLGVNWSQGVPACRAGRGARGRRLSPRARLEIGWDSVSWDESRLVNADGLGRILRRRCTTSTCDR